MRTFVKGPEPEAHLISISRIHSFQGVEVSMLRLRGSVRRPTMGDFERRLAEAGHRSPYLVVNLSELQYLGSRGLGLLLEQARLQERCGGWLRVVCPSPAVAMILHVSGAADRLPILADEDRALDGLTPLAA